MKNYELAQKLKKSQLQEAKIERNQNQNHSEDTLDRFKKEYQSKYAINDYTNPYERMSDNFHFRSSHIGDYPVPEKRPTLKPRDVKGIYLGNPDDKTNQ